MDTKKPWDFNPRITEKLLLTVIEIFRKARSDVIDLHDEALGDTRKSLGLRCYEVSRTQIIRKSGEIEGLSVITSDGRFTFALNGTPFRGVRNDPKKLPNKKLIKSLGAIRQIELLKKDEQCSEYAELIWYIVFDTYYKHPADNIYVVGYSEKNEIICQWEVPLDKVTLISSVNSEKAQAIEQPEPKPRLKSHNFTQKSSNDEK